MAELFEPYYNISFSKMFTVGEANIHLMCSTRLSTVHYALCIVHYFRYYVRHGQEVFARAKGEKLKIQETFKGVLDVVYFLLLEVNLYDIKAHVKV